jgi:hypothetical protein
MLERSSGWGRELDEPIALPGGKKLVLLRDAATLHAIGVMRALIDLSALHESAKANRKAVQPRAAIAAILFDRLKDRLPVTRRALYRRSPPAGASAVQR